MLFMEGRDSDPHVVWGKSKPVIHERNLRSSSLGSKSHGGHLEDSGIPLRKSHWQPGERNHLVVLGGFSGGSISSNPSWSLLHILVATNSKAHLHIKHLE